MKKEKEEKEQKKVAASNRKARQLYDILETYEAGLSLLGAEVKSLRGGKASLDGCYGRADNNEVFLFNFYIPPYSFSTVSSPDPRRTRKLLMGRREIDKILGKLQTKGLTLIPMEVYFKNGWAKVLLGLGKGKKSHDRRAELVKREVSREAEKSFKGKFRA